MSVRKARSTAGPYAPDATGLHAGRNGGRRGFQIRKEEAIPNARLSWN